MKIKLSQVDKRDYEEKSAELDRDLKKSPIYRSLNLSQFFSSYSGNLPVVLVPNAQAMVPKEEYEPEIYEIAFGLNMHEDSFTELARLLKSRRLNAATKDHLIRFYSYVMDRKPRSIKQVWGAFPEEDLIQDLTNLGYDVRFEPNRNCLSTSSIYNGAFSNQGVMTEFYRNLESLVDFDDLGFISFEDMVQKDTKKLFRKLEKIANNPEKYNEFLQRGYLNSPFTRLLVGLGFKNINIIGYEDEVGKGSKKRKELYFGDIEGRKSKELNFTVEIRNEDIDTSTTNLFESIRESGED